MKRHGGNHALRLLALRLLALRLLALPLVGVTSVFVSGCATTELAFRATSWFNTTEKARHAVPEVSVETENGTFVMTTPFLPGITVSGIVSRPTTQRVELYVTEARVFANWANGWTEGVYEASGTLYLTERRGDFNTAETAQPESATGTDVVAPKRDHQRSRYRRYYSVSVVDPIEIWSLTRGEIRYYDTYIRRDEGIVAVKARVDRLAALAEWLRERSSRRFFGTTAEAGTYGPPAITAVQRRLEAEYGPFDGDHTAADEATEADEADPITERTPGSSTAPEASTAPEVDPIAAIYRTGSVARDLREAPTLFTALYNLVYLNERLLESVVLEEG